MTVKREKESQNMERMIKIRKIGKKKIKDKYYDKERKYKRKMQRLQ